MKVVVCIYQKFINSKATSSGAQLGYLIGEELYKRHMLHSMIFSNVAGSKRKHIQSVSKIFKLFEIMFSALRKIKKVSSYKRRYVLEICYDILLRYKLQFCDFDILFTLNPWIPITSSFVKRKGKKIIYLAGNQNDNRYLKAVKREKTKLGITTFDAFDYLPRNKRYNNTLKNIDIIICINKLIEESFREDALCVGKTLLTYSYYFNADTDSLSYNSKKEVSSVLKIGYLAHTTVLKGLHILIDALEKAELVNVELYVGGTIEADYFSILEGKIRNNENIELLGNLRGMGKNNFFNMIDVFVCPSLFDASPATVTEALYCNKPVVLSSGVGNKLLIENGVNGFIYNDVNELIDILKWFNNNRDKIESMGLKANESFEKFANRENVFINKIVDIMK